MIQICDYNQPMAIGLLPSFILLKDLIIDGMTQLDSKSKELPPQVEVSSELDKIELAIESLMQTNLNNINFDLKNDS